MENHVKEEMQLIDPGKTEVELALIESKKFNDYLADTIEEGTEDILLAPHRTEELLEDMKVFSDRCNHLLVEHYGNPDSNNDDFRQDSSDVHQTDFNSFEPFDE